MLSPFILFPVKRNSQGHQTVRRGLSFYTGLKLFCVVPPSIILGIRNDRVNQSFEFSQPYIVREIGNRWGIDRISKPSGLGSLVNLGLLILN